MASYCIQSDFLAKGFKINELAVNNGTVLKVYSNIVDGTTYVVKGKVDSDSEWKTISAFKNSMPEITNLIRDDEVYDCDITGYSYVTVEVFNGADDIFIKGKIMNA